MNKGLNSDCPSNHCIGLSPGQWTGNCLYEASKLQSNRGSWGGPKNTREKNENYLVKSFARVWNTWFSVLDLNEEEQGLLAVLGEALSNHLKGHNSTKFWKEIIFKSHTIFLSKLKKNPLAKWSSNKLLALEWRC